MVYLLQRVGFLRAAISEPVWGVWSRMGRSVKCWTGFWVRSTVRLQLCRRESVVEDMGNKLAGLRGEQGENES